MELDFQIDTSWCPVCNRHILPKRYLVPVPPVQPTTTLSSQPGSTSPARKNPSSETSTIRPNRKNGTIRARGGLVHGTGRIKPNGTIKRSDSAQSTKKNRQGSSEQLPSPTTAQPVAPVKQRTVIDQGPTPLYCSDECRLADLNASFGALSPDYNPERQSPPMPPVPHSSMSVSPTSESDSSSSSDSMSEQPTATSLSHAALAPIYGFPPLPPPPPMVRRPSSPDQYGTNNYQSGVMMAAQRIKAALCPEPAPKRAGFTHPNQHQRPKERKPIPGWTDGSDAWRASVYSFSAPRDPAGLCDSECDDRRAYKSFVAASHRSGGVYSTLDSAYQTPAAPATSASTTSLQGLTRNRTVDELYSKYPLALSRRSESRSSLRSVSPTLIQARSLPTSVGPIVKKREVPLLKRGAEGKLLVPDVKLRVSTSYVSVSASSSATNDSYRSMSLVRRDSEHSVDSMASVSEVTEDEDTPASPGLVRPHRPTVETRSWSYDNLVTYPIMRLPPKKERRVEKRFVDGIEKDVEVEVELPMSPMKRLFLFPGKEVR